MRPARIFLFSLFALLFSCSELENAEDLFKTLSEKEQYQKENNISDELFAIWESRLETALKDSLQVELPYSETGELKPRNFAIYSYEMYLMPGEVLRAEFSTTKDSVLIFSSLFRSTSSAKKEFREIKSGKPPEKQLSFEIRKKGLYKLILQPEIEANTSFSIQIEKQPVYPFPVSGGKNADIGSYWGDIRDGGNRNHKGIDIFADRGTPVVATVDGRISYSGEKGLGGKQVWLRDSRRKQSLYYAHLDSIKPDLRRVKKGDTLGFVGNSGNARSTPPHLHFGIYRRGDGAIDPLGFVYQTDSVQNEIPAEELSSRIRIAASRANLRNKPASSNSEVLKQASSGEVLQVQGKTMDWFHVRDSLDRSMFVHESLVQPIY